MSELNSQITRLKITYLAKLPFFISLQSLCRYSSKAVSLLMRRTQEMGNRRTTHNVVRIKASDLLSRVPRFPLHSFSQGWCVGEGGRLASSLPAQNMWWSLLVSWSFLEESGGQLMLYLPPLLQPFITANITWSSFVWAPMQQLCILVAYFRRLLQTSCCILAVHLTASSLIPAWHRLWSKVWSFHLPSAKWMPVIVVVCWINWEGSICWRQTHSKTHPH